ncbi:MAG: DEAD/DEAH box helicase family protein [Anaerolineaceae bacterium]|nr:DEAD/DEAH box helicase family protein [Anaerolineaceae bacterium]
MPNFYDALEILRKDASDEFSKGRSLERLIQRALQQHPGIYGDRFSNVWLWNDWPERPGPDSGIDLVAEEAEGGLCAIQCKFYADDSPIPREVIDALIAASEDERFTSRMFINTGGEVRGNALHRIKESNKTKHCQVLDSSHLDEWDVDWREFVDKPEDLTFGSDARYTPHPYQNDAVADVCAGFESHDRGQLILPCGTGKTAVTLWIAEKQVGQGGRVLYLVPSIALMAQTMREWGDQKSLSLRYVGICSDTRAGRDNEDAALEDLDIPVTTDPAKILGGLQKERPDVMTVVFCTYQSLPLVADAQSAGAPDFDLVICDEAHRTTGVEVDDGEKKTSPFRLIHDASLIRARKRLYTTATPRIYTASAQSRAREADRNLEVFSMDKEEVYGPKFFHMKFSEAIDGGWLTDYKVIILTLKSGQIASALDNLLAQEQESGLDLGDAVKLLGCWDALADPEGVLADKNVTGDRHNSLRRAITFTNRIRDSKLVETHWGRVVDIVRRSTAREHQEQLLRLEVSHVDGTQNSLDRQRKLSWLRNSDTDDSGVCRVLTNARCLSEGVDVPALDAVLFLEPRKSQVDVVQAVGRVMRRAEGKQMGYIILPVVITPDQDPEKALDDNKTFQVVWSVLRALRSHDESFDLEINSLDLNNSSRRIKIINIGEGDENGDEQGAIQVPLDLIYAIPPGAVYARIVEKCGDRKYWPQWAADVEKIAESIRTQVAGMVRDTARISLQRDFQSFLSDLQQTLNPEIKENDLVAMVAQHLVTEPVFQALFADYKFAECNPVSRSLDQLVEVLKAEGLEDKTQAMKPFYDSVRQRAQTLDNAKARQKVLLELYNNFFSKALKKEAERLGIVYTPIQVVDFILKSADHALQKHLGRRLTDENVHVLDPFTGTGTFIVRLLQNPELIRDEDLLRKFSSELHANEIVLLAYYIAAINIEEAYHGRLGMDAAYKPFKGIAFSDTFQQYEREQEEREREERGELGDEFNETLPVNSARVQRQQAQEITAIVGNPPYSAKQRSASDNNPNISYPQLARRVAETFAARSKATNRGSLYDTYKLAIRWASDRISAEGVIAFVTNGSFIDGNADAGLRACLAEEFSHLYVVNLRGNARTSGERRRREKDNVFGAGTRTPVAIMVLVRDPARSGPGEIHYRDIGDYLSRKDKLRMLEDWTSIAGVADWQIIRPDDHNDWLEQRDPTYQAFLQLGHKDAKRNKLAGPDTLFRLYSTGVVTGWDAWLLDFDRGDLTVRVRDLITFYETQRLRIATGEVTFAEATLNNAPDRFKWHRELKDRLRRGRELTFQESNLRTGMYRPFLKKFLFFDDILISQKLQTQRMFPLQEATNQIIGVTGRGGTNPFSTLMVSDIPEYLLIFSGQWFSRYRYERLDAAQPALMSDEVGGDAEAVPGYRRVDNLTDWGLHQFRERYPALHITKDDVWHYIYGLLHAPDYREKYRADLSKDLPRIPFAPDFEAFCNAGEQLAALHLGYETCAEFDLPVQISGNAANPYHLGDKRMKWGGTSKEKDYSVLHVTPFVTLSEIPAEAHDYVVNGRTPLEWAVDRLKVTRDKESGIVSDPNAWFADDPAGLVAHLRRLVQVSVETARIVGNLPAALT